MRCEMQSEIKKKYILCWVSFSYSQKSYSMQMKRLELKTCIFECFNAFHGMVLVFYTAFLLEHDELNLVVQVLEGHLLRNPRTGILTPVNFFSVAFWGNYAEDSYLQCLLSVTVMLRI